MPNYNVNLSRFEQNLNDKNAPVKIFKHSSKFIGQCRRQLTFGFVVSVTFEYQPQNNGAFSLVTCHAFFLHRRRTSQNMNAGSMWLEVELNYNSASTEAYRYVIIYKLKNDLN